MAEFSAGILLVGHDAQAHGAQLLLLNIARKLKRQWGIKVHLLLLGVGPLLGKYYETAEVSVAYDKTIIGNLLDNYKAMGIRAAIVNSAASARVVPWLEQRGISATMLVHEMPQLLKEYNLEIQARLGAGAASNLVFSSGYLRDKFAAAVELRRENAVVLAQGNYQEMRFDEAARTRIRRELGIGDEQFLVLGAGFGHIRKGFDLFLQMARTLAARRSDVHFVWVGDIEFMLRTYLAPEMERRAGHRMFHAHPLYRARGGIFLRRGCAGPDLARGPVADGGDGGAGLRRALRRLRRERRHPRAAAPRRGRARCQARRCRGFPDRAGQPAGP